MRDFAARLIAHEAGARSAEAAGSVAFVVLNKLRTPLATLMGNGGHRALLMRAKALAGVEVPWLCALQVAVDGTLDHSDPSWDSVAPEHQLEGGVVLVAQLIGLLVAFIGAKLSLQLVAEAWPKLPAGELYFNF